MLTKNEKREAFRRAEFDVVNAVRVRLNTMFGHNRFTVNDIRHIMFSNAMAEMVMPAVQVSHWSKYRKCIRKRTKFHMRSMQRNRFKF